MYELSNKSISDTNTFVLNLSETLRISEGPSSTRPETACMAKIHRVIACTSRALPASCGARCCCQHLKPSYARMKALQYHGKVHKQNMSDASYKENTANIANLRS